MRASNSEFGMRNSEKKKGIERFRDLGIQELRDPGIERNLRVARNCDKLLDIQIVTEAEKMEKV